MWWKRTRDERDKEDEINERYEILMKNEPNTKCGEVGTVGEEIPLELGKEGGSSNATNNTLDGSPSGNNVILENMVVIEVTTPKRSVEPKSIMELAPIGPLGTILEVVMVPNTQWGRVTRSRRGKWWVGCRGPCARG